jgi:hypothetical protein
MHAVLRHRRRRFEPLTGEQHRVGEKPGQLAEIVPPALAQVGQRLLGDPDGNRRDTHQLRVGRGLPAEADRGDTGAEQDGQAALPGAPPGEQPDHRDVDTGEQPG